MSNKKMKNIIVNENITLNTLRKLKGHTSEFYTAEVTINNQKVNITYFIDDDTIVVHEWFLLGRETAEKAMDALTKFFHRITKELYPAATV